MKNKQDSQSNMNVAVVAPTSFNSWITRTYYHHRQWWAALVENEAALALALFA